MLDPDVLESWGFDEGGGRGQSKDWHFLVGKWGSYLETGLSLAQMTVMTKGWGQSPHLSKEEFVSKGYSNSLL